MSKSQVVKNNRKTTRGRKVQIINLPNGRTKKIIHKTTILF